MVSAKIHSMENPTKAPVGDLCGYCHHHGGTKVARPEMLPRLSDGPLASGDTSLTTYFNEMATLPIFQPEEELERALNIQSSEEALWSQILDDSSLSPALALLFEERGDKSLSEPFGSFRLVCPDPSSRFDRGARQHFALQLNRTARALRQADPDREALQEVYRMLQTIAREGAFQIGQRRVSVHTDGKSFTARLLRINHLYEQSQVARNEFVKANLKLVVTISRRYYFGQLSFHDLIQEGNIGLIKAVGRYDPMRGYRFSTYAAWWIRHAVTRALSNKGRLVRLPVQFLGNRFKVARASQELAGQLGRAPTNDELCRCTGLEMEKVEQLQETPSGFELSLDSALDNEEGGRRFIEMLHDPDAPSPVETAMSSEILERVEHALDHLKPIEADVVRERFGLTDGKGHTLEEVGEFHNLSRERIRQIQNRAIDKIRFRLGFSPMG